MFKIKPGVRFILASASPRRLALLRGVGLEFEVQVSNCDETPLQGETPAAMVERLAKAKAHSVANNFPDAWVLGADTTVVLDDEILGKPENKADAHRMLSLIQGREHTVWGAFALVNLKSNTIFTGVHSSRVAMAAMSDQLIKQYIDTCEPLDKAGSYAIQGVGAGLVKSVAGSYTNVVGLNLSAVLQTLHSHYLLV